MCFGSKHAFAASGRSGVAIEHLQPRSFVFHPALPGEAPA
jgi:hypothetical protein